MNSNSGETLTEAMLAALPQKLRPIRQGKYLRAGCPFHGSDKTRSLSINTETGRFECFACQVWGYTEQAREEWRRQHQQTPAPRRPPWEGPGRAETLSAPTATPELLPAEWLERLEQMQSRLPEAAQYLEARRIPLDLVRSLGGGVGLLDGAPGLRLVLPHTNPVGEVVSLYGRRIDGGEERKHHHLSRPKGFLNAQVAIGSEVWLTEGPFDALALLAAGFPAASCFGVNGIRWEWLKPCRRLVLAFDADEAGRNGIEKQGRQAILRGLSVEYLTPEELGGAKDVGEAWERGVLNIEGGPSPAVSIEPLLESHWTAKVADLPEHPPGRLPGDKWLAFRQAAQDFASRFGDLAQEAGWSELDIFGLPHPDRPWEAGALWLTLGADITEVSPQAIRTARGSVYPDSVQPHQLPWD